MVCVSSLELTTDSIEL